MKDESSNDTSPDKEDRFCQFPNGICLCYRTHGDPAGEPLVLIAGLGLQLTSWPPALVDGLVERGFFVVRFDNRDVGRSTKAVTPPPSKLRQLLALPRPDNYDLRDMADDTVGLLDHLRIEAAHLVGVSMGGMIAQTLAARQPKRCRTLTSIFSTTGHRLVGQPHLSTILHLAQPPARTQTQAIARHLDLIRHVAGPRFPVDEASTRAYAAEAWERGAGPAYGTGLARQIGAIQKSGDRTEQLRRITAPTLVIHGEDDLMVHPSGGRATASAIPDAHHVSIPGMGHYLAPALIPQLVDLISEHAQTGASRQASPSNNLPVEA